MTPVVSLFLPNEAIYSQEDIPPGLRSRLFHIAHGHIQPVRGAQTNFGPGTHARLPTGGGKYVDLHGLMAPRAREK